MHLLLLTALLLDTGQPVTKTLARPDGVRITYDVRGSGRTTLVFVHGWASERSAWREQANYFASFYQVVTLDLAGHGQSTAGRRKAWTVAALAGDVRALVERLKPQRVILVGHSMGGPVSLLAAAQVPAVKAVVLVDAVHNAESRLTREQAEGFAGAFDRDFRGTLTPMVRAMFPAGSPLADEVIAKAVSRRPQVLTALIRDQANIDAARLLQAVRVPIRAVNGGDTATNLAVNRKYADFDATVLSDAHHYLMLEKPGEFNAMLREWLTVLQ